MGRFFFLWKYLAKSYWKPQQNSEQIERKVLSTPKQLDTIVYVVIETEQIKLGKKQQQTVDIKKNEQVSKVNY